MLNFALCVLAAICLFLAWHPKYEDGLFGRIWLGGIVVMCVIILVGEWRGLVRYEFSLEIVCFIFFVAFFFVRHCYRFILWAYWGKHAWKAGKKNGDPACGFVDAEASAERKAA